MKRQRIAIPPLWFAILVTLIGIVGMRLVYGALLGTGSLPSGIIGAVLLALALFVVGTPLAYARYLRKEVKARSHTR